MDVPHTLADPVRKHAKQAFDRDPKVATNFEQFLERLLDPASSAALPIKVDLEHPLSSYFISTSHNTYLSGNQLWGKSTTDAYKNVLKRGCRCIEVDIWDGDSPSSSGAEDEADDSHDVGKLSSLLKKGLSRIRSHSNPDKPQEDSPASTQTLMPTPWRTESGRDEPVVYHGHTATSEMPFRKVCEVVREYAFRTSNLPLIVSLELHCSPPQQEMVAQLMTDYWGEFLFQLPKDFSDSTPLPPLSTLKNKILVKVKYTPPEKATKADKKPSKRTDDPEATEEEDSTKANQTETVVEKLSNMGIFTRAFHFSSFDQPEAQIPTHVFSLSESKLLECCREQPDELFDHNLQYLMRAYPKSTRVTSSNLDPAPLWRFGIQMVALNYQKLNAAMMLNTAQFEDSDGWILKPQGYLPTKGKQSCAATRVTMDLSVKIFAGQHLGADHDIPNAYVKCELHVESKAEAKDGQIPNGGKNKGGEWKRQTAVRHGRDPDFGAAKLEFKGVQQVVPEMSFLRLKVMDDALAQKDRMLGWICYRLDRLPRGLLLLHLRGEDSKATDGKLLIEVETQIERCAPSAKAA
ncbi:1-phosphatidylinositol 4,5-bisphosphate phosphodiesterase 1 [Lecanosticta acicola]|uniref:Phosphoinositide phospholipase C n=1 Tax=Lecanosticta acicola TaxID=111012 RepID=A0AAI9EDZ7_9PEZI|nr:1-phosphatidylinositol 4,5-bisphosphate phosphodiesterase 1 [Lecanosticta acicola]